MLCSHQKRALDTWEILGKQEGHAKMQQKWFADFWVHVCGLLFSMNLSSHFVNHHNIFSIHNVLWYWVPSLIACDVKCPAFLYMLS